MARPGSTMDLDVGDDRDEDEDLDPGERDDDDNDGDRPRTGRRRAGDDDGTGRSSEDDDDDDDDDDLSEEELRAELKRLRAAVSKAGKQTARQRSQRKALEAQLRERQDDAGDDEDDEDDEGDGKAKAPTAKSLQKTVSRAVRAKERELEEAHRRDRISDKAEAALTRAGVSDRNVRLLLKELDMDEVDYDAKTRSFDGLDDEIDRLKDEFPDLFRKPKGERRRINGGDDRDRGSRSRKPMTATEKQVAQLRGR